MYLAPDGGGHPPRHPRNLNRAGNCNEGRRIVRAMKQSRIEYLRGKCAVWLMVAVAPLAAIAPGTAFAARTVAALASPAARHITGEMLLVDAGSHLNYSPLAAR